MRLTEFLHQVNKYTVLIERDVINAGEIKKWVASMSARVLEPQVQKWFQSQLFQFLINRFELRSAVQPIREIPPGAPDWLVKKIEDGGEPVYNIEISPNFTENTMAVIDYINAWSQDNPGREPRMRWEQAAEQSGKWHNEMQKATVSAEENEQDLSEVTTIYEFKDGYKWVDVNTEVCLKREGSRMGHCVGGYGSQVASGTTKIFSLRSSKNVPHATIEATSEEPTTIVGADNRQGDMFSGEGNLPPLKVEQVKGRSNEPPVKKYIPYVKEFLEWGNFELGNGGAGDIEKMGLYNKQGKYYTLPEVSTPVKKYKDGDMWVRLDDKVESTNSSGVLKEGNPYKLVDKDYNIKAEATTTEQGSISRVSTPYHGTKESRKADREEIKTKVLDLLNKNGIQADKNGWMSNSFKNDWGIYSNNNKHGDLHDVATKLHDLPNGNKVVEASNSFYILNDKNKLVFEYEQGIGDIHIAPHQFNSMNLNMNYGDLIQALSDVTGEDIDNSSRAVNVKRDSNGNVLKPKGEPIYSNNGISWHNGNDIPLSSTNKDNMYVGYDAYENPLYYVELGDDGGTAEDVGFLLGGSRGNIDTGDRKRAFKPGEDVISLILNEDWDTDETFVTSMFEDFMWAKDENDTWWKTDDNAPAKYEETTSYEETGDDDETFNEDNATLEMFWTETSLFDTGLDSDFFIEMYSRFFHGLPIHWDEPDRERDDVDPETGEGIVTIYSTDYSAEFTGDAEDYMHPDQI